MCLEAAALLQQCDAAFMSHATPAKDRYFMPKAPSCILRAPVLAAAMQSSCKHMPVDMWGCVCVCVCACAHMCH